MASEIRIEGEPELARSLSALEGDLRDLSLLNGEVADRLAARIADLAPRDTGRLAGSWRGEGKSDKAEASSDVAYAGPQNYGVPAHNIAGTHYAERALAESTGTIESEYSTGVEKLCRKAET